MKKFSLLVLISVLICLSLTSCELSYNADKPTIHVVAMGINYYDVPSQRISGDKDIDDAVNVMKAFRALASKAGYNFDYRLLIDSSSTKYEEYKTFTDYPTYSNFVKSLSSFDALESDITIIYFSGHGSKENQLVVINDTHTNTAFQSFSTVKKDIDTEVPGTKIILCDTCYSSFVPVSNGVTVNSSVSSENPLTLLFDRNVNESSSIISLSASTYLQQSSAGDSRINRSVFTNSLLKGLGWDSKNSSLGTIPALKNNKLTIANIAKYVYTDVQDVISEYGYTVSTGEQITTFYGGSADIILFKF